MYTHYVFKNILNKIDKIKLLLLYVMLFVLETAEPVHDGFNYLRNTYFY